MKPEADVLASVQKKLAEGLPPVEPKAAGNVPPAPPAEAPAPAAPDRRTELRPSVKPQAATVVPAAYKVQPGQSLWSIAADQLGNGNRYLEILDLNPELQRDPGRIVPGQELRLPSPSN